MKNKSENKSKIKNENDIEIIIGDSSSLEISDVNDCMNPLRPKTSNDKKKNIIIPRTKKKISNTNQDKNQ